MVEGFDFLLFVWFFFLGWRRQHLLDVPEESGEAQRCLSEAVIDFAIRPKPGRQPFGVACISESLVTEYDCAIVVSVSYYSTDGLIHRA